jgi:gluconokinase
MASRPVVVMGVSGSGKSTVGAALAARLGVPFEDGDDLHPTENVAKMARGVPLDDADRHPWLERIGAWLADHSDGGVIACSALTRGYRDQLRRHCPEVDFLHLDGDPEVIARRQAGRTGHFMPPSLLPTQLHTLEPITSDESGLVVDIDQPVDAIVDEYVAARGGSAQPSS